MLKISPNSVDEESFSFCFQIEFLCGVTYDDRRDEHSTRQSFWVSQPPLLSPQAKRSEMPQYPAAEHVLSGDFRAR